MPDVIIELPSLLRHVTGTPARLEMRAESVSAALQALIQQHPALRVHIFDESGSLRPHVLCFHNERNTRWMESMDAPLQDGDRITILQAVSGG